MSNDDVAKIAQLQLMGVMVDLIVDDLSNPNAILQWDAAKTATDLYFTKHARQQYLKLKREGAFSKHGDHDQLTHGPRKAKNQQAATRQHARARVRAEQDNARRDKTLDRAGDTFLRVANDRTREHATPSDKDNSKAARAVREREEFVRARNNMLAWVDANENKEGRLVAAATAGASAADYGARFSQTMADINTKGAEHVGSRLTNVLRTWNIRGANQSTSLDALEDSLNAVGGLYANVFKKRWEKAKTEMGGRPLAINRIGHDAFESNLGPRNRESLIVGYLGDEVEKTNHAEWENGEVRPQGVKEPYLRWDKAKKEYEIVRYDTDDIGGKRSMPGFIIDSESGDLLGSYIGKHDSHKKWPLSYRSLSKVEGNTVVRGRRTAGFDQSDIKWGLLSGAKEVVTVSPEAATKITFSAKIRKDPKAAMKYYTTYKSAYNEMASMKREHEKVKVEDKGYLRGKVTTKEKQQVRMFSDGEAHRIAVEMANQQHPNLIRIEHVPINFDPDTTNRKKLRWMKEKGGDPYKSSRGSVNFTSSSGTGANGEQEVAGKPQSPYKLGGTRVAPEAWMRQIGLFEPSPGEKEIMERVEQGGPVARKMRKDSPVHVAQRALDKGVSPAQVNEVLQKGMEREAAFDAYQGIMETPAGSRMSSGSEDRESDLHAEAVSRAERQLRTAADRRGVNVEVARRQYQEQLPQIIDNHKKKIIAEMEAQRERASVRRPPENFGKREVYGRITKKMSRGYVWHEPSHVERYSEQVRKLALR